MAKAKSTRLFVGAILALQMFVANPSQHGRVLCIGENGHVEIEVAQDGHCIAADVQHDVTSQNRAALATAESPHCGPCTDVPLVASQVACTVKSARNAATDFSARPAFGHRPERLSVFPVPHSKPGNSPHWAGAVGSLGTTVLLI